MYRKFKSCLLKPSHICYYVGDKTSKVILYFLLIALIYILPNCINVIHPRGLSDEVASYISEIFEQGNTVNYEIIDTKESIVLKSKLEESKKEKLLTSIIYDSYQLNCIFLFDDSGEELNITNFGINSNILEQAQIVSFFSKDSIALYSANQFIISDNNSSNGVIEVSESKIEPVIEASYKKLGFSNIDFSLANKNSLMFKKEINNLYLSIYNTNKAAIVLFTLPTLVISTIFAILIEMVMLVVVIKILYMKNNFKFGILLKIVIYAYTPLVVLNLLSVFWGNTILQWIGHLISVIYIMIAMKHYSIGVMAQQISEELINQLKQQQNSEEATDEGDNNEL